MININKLAICFHHSDFSKIDESESTSKINNFKMETSLSQIINKDNIQRVINLISNMYIEVGHEDLLSSTQVNRGNYYEVISEILGEIEDNKEIQSLFLSFVKINRNRIIETIRFINNEKSKNSTLFYNGRTYDDIPLLRFYEHPYNVDKNKIIEYIVYDNEHNNLMMLLLILLLISVLYK